jgi:hypothetical protein
LSKLEENTKKKWKKHAIEWFGALVVFSLVRFFGDAGSAIGFITMIQAICVIGVVFCLVKISKAPQ